jgi:hypothetical protein
MSTVACAIVGGFLGYHGFVLLLDHGSYALVLPGGLAGWSPEFREAGQARAGPCAAWSPSWRVYWPNIGLLRSWSMGVSGTFCHAHNLKPMTLILIGLGGFIGFWVPFRRRVRRV